VQVLLLGYCLLPSADITYSSCANTCSVLDPAALLQLLICVKGNAVLTPGTTAAAYAAATAHAVYAVYAAACAVCRCAVR
jgi:hypothetical protein